MTITLDVHYGATPYYNSGRKTIQVEWGSNPHPQRNTYINLQGFIKDHISEKETFILDGKFINIFSYVELRYGWQVSEVFLECSDGEITWRYLIEESQKYRISV